MTNTPAPIRIADILTAIDKLAVKAISDGNSPYTHAVLKFFKSRVAIYDFLVEFTPNSPGIDFYEAAMAIIHAADNIPDIVIENER